MGLRSVPGSRIVMGLVAAAGLYGQTQSFSFNVNNQTNGFADNNAGRELAGHLGETKYAPGVGQQGRMVAAKSSAAKSESASFSTLSEAIHFFRAPGMTDERE